MTIGKHYTQLPHHKNKKADCSETEGVDTYLISEPTQMFFYSPVKYIGQALDRMLKGVHARKLTIEHLPLPLVGGLNESDLPLLVEWRNCIHRSGRSEYFRWVDKAKKEGFWDGVDLRPV